MLKVKDIAENLGCSPSLVYGILKDGKLRYRIIGKKHIVITEEDFEEYLEKTIVGSKNNEEPV